MLFFKTECCNLPGSVLGALGIYTAMSLDVVVQAILCVQHSKHLISVVWDSWRMLIKLFSLVFYPLLKIVYLWNTFQCYLFSTNPSQKKQPSSSWAGCPKLLRKVEILQSHTDFIAFAVTVCLQLLTVLSAEVQFIVICLLNLDWTELGFSITGLFRGWIFHTLIITSMTVCRKQRCSMAMWGRDAVSKWGCDSPCWHLTLVLNPPVPLGLGNSECSGIWGSAFLGGKQLCFG